MSDLPICWVPGAAGNLCHDSRDLAEEGGQVQRSKAEFGGLGTMMREQTERNFDGNCK